MRFRKKPIVIEAVKVADVLSDIDGRLRGNPTNLPEWTRLAMRDGTVALNGTGLRVHTLEGDHFANPDDWIIRGVKGELYPIKPDIFTATYEPVSEQP